MSYRNTVAQSTCFNLTALLYLRRPLVASLAGVLLGILPATAGENHGDSPSPHAADSTVPGSLVIVGGGGLPDAIRDCFLELAGGKKGRLVVIPTASEVADHRRIYRSFDYWKKFDLASVDMLHTLDPKQADDPAFVKPLQQATAAWLGGGDQTRLARIYRGTAVEKELRRLLERGGVIGGTSAGASIMSSVMITGGNPQAHIGQGFGLLPDVVIDQHFENRKRQNRLLGVLAKHPDCLGLGIDEETAVVVRGNEFRVLGDANVVICMPPRGNGQPSTKVLKSGQSGDLFQLRSSVVTRLKPSSESKASVTKTTRATTP